MRNVLSLLLCGLLGCLALISCGKDHGNPSGPNEGKYVLKGTVSTTKPLMNISIHITGNGVNRTVLSGTDGVFTVSGLEAGAYTVRAEDKNYYFFPDSLEVAFPGSDNRILEFFAFSPGYPDLFTQSHQIVCGRITTVDGNPVANVKVNDATTSPWGFYSIATHNGQGSALTLTPSKKGYDYRFSPDSLKITLDHLITIADFTASYSGPPLHSISGRWKNNTVVPMSWMMFTAQKGTDTIWVNADSLGWFQFAGLLDGEYVITGMDSFSWEPQQATIELKGSDAQIPDFVALSYIGPAYYNILMKAVNENGNGIPDVTIYWQKTDRAGVLQLNQSVTKAESKRNFTFTPQKEGFTFTPESVKVTLEWKEKMSQETVTIPDFVGKGYPILFAEDYFPLRIGSSWTYERTKTGEPSQEYTFGISGKTTIGIPEFFHTSGPGPAGLTDFRIVTTSVLTSYENHPAELFRFEAPAGKTWDIGRTPKDYPVTGTFLGIEAAATPSGAYPDCAKYEVRILSGASGTSYELYTLWFAKGIGMARSEYTLVNYGQTKESVTLALKSYTP